MGEFESRRRRQPIKSKTMTEQPIDTLIRNKNHLIQHAGILEGQSKKAYLDAAEIELAIACKLARYGKDWTVNAMSAMDCYRKGGSEPCAEMVLRKVYHETY